MAHYIITGICGHLGNTLAHKLVAKGHTVSGLALPNEDSSMLEGLPVNLYRGDIRDEASLLPLFENAKDAYVIHCAGIITVASGVSRLVEDVNVRGTENILSMCGRFSVRRLVYISTVDIIPQLQHGYTAEAAFFDPGAYQSQYAVTKAKASNLVLQAAKEGLSAVVVHPTAIVGPGDYGTGPATKMILMYLSGKLTLAVKGGYDFVDVRDVANGVIAAAEKGRSGECYILGGAYLTIHQALNLLAKVSGGANVRRTLPGWLVRLSVPLLELSCRITKKKPAVTASSLDVLESNGHYSTEKARNELGYLPRDIKDSFTDTVAFLRRTGRVAQ